MQELTFNELPGAITLLLERLNNIERLLLEKNNIIQQEPDQLLTIKQASEFLNLKVNTIYGLTHRSVIPVCKQGNKLYFSKQTLMNWIKEGKRKTVSEIAIEAEQYLTKKKEGVKL